MEINDKGYYGCALDMPEDDKRLPRYENQRLERGWDDTETWNLNTSLSRYMAPRLRRLSEIQKDFIVEPYEGYFTKLETLANAFEMYNEDSWNKEALETIQKIFPEVFPYLWW